MTGINGSADRIPPPPRPIELRGVDARGWWHSVLLGLVLVGLGVWILANLYESVVALAWLVGIALIVAGGIEAVVLEGRHDRGWVGWVASAALLVAGIVVLSWPDITLQALAVVAGLCLLVAGGSRLVLAFIGRDRPDRGLDFGLGVFGIVTGVVVLAWPHATLVVLAVFLGIRVIGTGLLAIGLGWQRYRLAR